MAAPQPVLSPRRAAGLPPMNTLVLPAMTALAGCGVGAAAHVWVVPSTAAGKLPIRTLGTPLPTRTPG